MTATDTASAPLAHLQGRDANLAQFGWTPKQAEWVALVCLHSGCFLRSQMAAYLGIARQRVSDFMHSLVDRQFAVEVSLQQAGTPRLCRVSHKAIYRALDAENIRYRRAISPRVTFARVLALDYILEHPNDYWLPTEYDKVRFFHNDLNVPKSRLPSRVYQGHAGGRRRYFPDKFPICASSDTVTMIYVDAGYPTDRPLRRWASEHRAFFTSIHEVGYQLRIVFISANASALPRTRTVLEGWTVIATGSPEAAIPLLEELDAIKSAVVNADEERLAAWGGLHQAMARKAQLKHDCALLETQSKSPLIDNYSLWHSRRLDGIDFQLLDHHEFTSAEPFDA